MNWLRLFSIAIGALLYYAAMRYFVVSDYFWYLVDAGLVLACSSLVFTWLHLRRSKSKGLTGEAHSYRYTMIWQGLLVFALLAHVAYFWTTKDAPQIDTFVKKLFLVLVVVAVDYHLEHGYRYGNQPACQWPRAFRGASTSAQVRLGVVVGGYLVSDFAQCQLPRGRTQPRCRLELSQSHFG